VVMQIRTTFAKGIVMTAKLEKPLTAKRLSNLPAALEARGFQPLPNFRYLREAAINRISPASQINWVWHFEPADLPEIEEKLLAAYKTRRKSRATCPHLRSRRSIGSINQRVPPRTRG
jgi:hypothetical protein